MQGLVEAYQAAKHEPLDQVALCIIRLRGGRIDRRQVAHPFVREAQEATRRVHGRRMRRARRSDETRCGQRHS